MAPNEQPPRKGVGRPDADDGKPPYQAPPKPPVAATMRGAELTLRPDDGSSVRVVFRTPCRNFRHLLHQLITEGQIARGQCYHPEHLRRWTLPLLARLRRDTAMGGALRAITHRLGLLAEPSVAFCLDGFFHGAAEFGNIHGSDEAPRMLVQPGSTPDGLHLLDGDSIFISVSQAAG